jgi:hypothetical protein
MAAITPGMEICALRGVEKGARISVQTSAGAEGISISFEEWHLLRCYAM